MTSNERKSEVFRISSEGDLEVAIFHENQAAFTDIINPDLYTVVGNSPNQHILFHTDSCFNLFLIYISEMFAEGSNNVVFTGKN